MKNYLDNEGLNVPPGIEDPADSIKRSSSKNGKLERKESKPSITFNTFESLDDYESKGE